MLKILMTGGGTAGHINPALAIAQTVKEQEPGAIIEFVGTEKGKEKELVPAEGYRLHYVKAQGFVRSLDPRTLPGNIKSLYYAITSPRGEETQRILRDFEPDLVIGTGGYASWPLVRAAQKMGIPTMLHESNAKPGLALKLLSKGADCTLVNFEKTLEALPGAKRAVHVGNPLRRGFGKMTKREAKRRLNIPEDDFFILSFGGSLGAEEVNRSMVYAMEHFSGITPHVRHLHGCGSRDYNAVKALYDGVFPKGNDACRVVEYIHDMPLWMTAADLVITRAGAMTVSELALLGKAAILIPSPYVASDHQYQNARVLWEAGAASLFREKKDLSEDERHLMCLSVLSMIESLYNDPDERQKCEQRITSFAEPRANQMVWQEIARICGAGIQKTEKEKERMSQ